MLFWNQLWNLMNFINHLQIAVYWMAWYLCMWLTWKIWPCNKPWVLKYMKQLFLFFIKFSCSWPEFQLFVDVTVSIHVESGYSDILAYQNKLNILIMCTLALKFMNVFPKTVQKLSLLKTCTVSVLNSKDERRGNSNSVNTQGLRNSTNILLNFIK